MRIAASLAMLLLTAAGAVEAQGTRLGDGCDLAVVGAKDTAGFLAFDRELRAAVTARDPAATALLVEFPLRVNTGHGSYSLNDPAMLQARFAEVFSPSVRRAIVEQKAGEVFCNSTGVMYGSGLVWAGIARQGYAIQVINLPADASRETAGREVAFVCRTERHRVVIDVTAAGVPRYRSWNRPHAPTDPPDLEIAAGKRDYEGTGPCAAAIWTFHAAATTYSLEEAGCAPAPKGATAQLTVSTGGKTLAEWWCY
ncbi:MAG: hypothetical protein KGN36_14235 [Acidobacteriota bacterium]|nr:hypothetical protein [Acidobacteriota bacterium]